LLLSAASENSGVASARKEEPRLSPVAVWLFTCCAMIFLMVVVGGITRLTLSGLSITEWKPVVGILPPLSAADWAAEFAKYKEVPEYRAVHFAMTLAEFKGIYYWEYFHRLLGRLIGVAFAVPFVWFLVRRRLPQRRVLPLAGILLLGFAQGLLGWYMVESGLADRVEVSQYRLVAHLALALAIYSAILWVALGIVRASTGPVLRSALHGEEQHELPMAGLDPAIHLPGSTEKGVDGRAKPGHGAVLDGQSVRATPRPEDFARGWRRASEVLLALVALTILAGGFVAGTRAGLTYNTFPLMDGRLVPPGYDQLHPFYLNWFENIAAVQFDHRVLAVATFTAVLLLWTAGLRTMLPKPARIALHLLMAAAALQVALGISTLLLVVPVPLAAAHQAGAILVLTAAVVLRHTMRPAEI
jgi:cytochrome c oxidase assembly protein subunit 15